MHRRDDVLHGTVGRNETRHSGIGARHDHLFGFGDPERDDLHLGHHLAKTARYIAVAGNNHVQEQRVGTEIGDLVRRHRLIRRTYDLNG